MGGVRHRAHTAAELSEEDGDGGAGGGGENGINTEKRRHEDERRGSADGPRCSNCFVWSRRRPTADVLTRAWVRSQAARGSQEAACDRSRARVMSRCARRDHSKHNLRASPCVSVPPCLRVDPVMSVRSASSDLRPLCLLELYRSSSPQPDSLSLVLASAGLAIARPRPPPHRSRARGGTRACCRRTPRSRTVPDPRARRIRSRCGRR